MLTTAQQKQDEFMAELIAAMEEVDQTGHGVISGLPSDRLNGIGGDPTYGQHQLPQSNGEKFTMTFRGRY